MIADNIFILTGAGISAESGLATFRDADGLWEGYPVMEVASIQAYDRNPARVLEFYNLRRAQQLNAKPNRAHVALAQLEAHWRAHGGSVTICTQNVDSLHEQAGSTRVIHMHGEINKARCHDCGDVTLADGDLSPALGCAACGRIGGMRPHIVWFGETPLEMDAIYDALATADLFVSIGTSGAVYPAAGFVSAVRRAGAPTMEMNLEPSENAEAFDLARYGKAGDVVPEWVTDMIKLSALR